MSEFANEENKKPKALAKMHSSPFILPYSLLYYSNPEIMNSSQRTSAPGSSILYHASPGPPTQFHHTELSPNWEYALIF